MNVLLVPLGSHGDVHPFVGLGLALKARGHTVRVIVNPFFGPLVEQAGLELIPLGKTSDYTDLAGNPELWNKLNGTKAVLRGIAHFIRPIYSAVVANHVPGQTVVVASTLALGARTAQDRHQIPTATVHLQPSVFRSYIDPPTLAGMWLGKDVPRWIMALQWTIADRLVVDRILGPELNGLRKELGLGPVKHILRDYIHSPQRTIGMFPDWYAAPQADWPAHVSLSGFPLYDERGVSALPADLRQFLDAGEKPIAFTFGSAMWHAHELLEQSAQACTLLNRRGVLLTRHREQVPARLPPGVVHADFAPFGELLPRCAALVHHGGIGTASQGLAAGIPQLILPHAHDQLDNATRLQRLGVSRMIAPERYSAEAAANELGALLTSEDTARHCKSVAGRFAGDDVMKRNCDLIEAMA